MKPVVNVLGPQGLEHKQGTEEKRKTDGAAQRRPQSAGHLGTGKEGYRPRCKSWELASDPALT